MPKTDTNSRSWSSAKKFAVVLKAPPMNETERAEYVGRKALFMEY